MSDLIPCTALRVVKADRLYRPGEELDLEAADAAELEAMGAVRRLPDEEPHPGAGTRPASTVHGLGPKTEARLAELGVDSLGALAELPDDRLEAVTSHLGAPPHYTLDVVRDWRDEARRLIEAGAGDA